MTSWLNLFDSYSRQARLYPALITLFPAIALSYYLLPTAFNVTSGASLITLGTACGLIFLLAEISRSAGRKTEVKLIENWGGWPTTIWLRHRSTQFNQSTKLRVHKFLNSNIKGLTMPSAAIERANLVEADNIYVSATTWLKAQCRGPEFALLLNENAGYGFRRNLLGLKPIGITVSVVCCAIVAVNSVVLDTSLKNGWEWSNVTIDTAKLDNLKISLAVSAISLFAWIAFVNEKWVRVAGDRYAVALFNCCDSIKPAKQG